MKHVSCYVYKDKFKLVLKQQLSCLSTISASKNINNNVERKRITPPTVIAAVDSGASDNYFPATFTGENHRCPTISHAVGTANGNIMRSVATDRFTMPGVPSTGRGCKKFYEVDLPLVSVGKLCVNGMKVSFADEGVEVKNKSNGAIVTTGCRDPVRNLYMLPIPNSVQHEPQGVGLNLIEPVQATKNELYAANAYEI